MTAPPDIPQHLRRICQSALPAKPWAVPALNRLPGMMPVGADDWIIEDAVWAEQMALRDHLVQTRPGEILAQTPGSAPVIAEALAAILEVQGRRGGYEITSSHVTRPDGVAVPLADPLSAIARLVQEDICLLARSDGEDEHRLVAATLAFPASWSLEEKLGRPLTGIHDPVAPYDGNLANRVERLFSGLRPGRPLMRMNALIYENPCLFQPRRETARRDRSAARAYLRSERQCLLRLPETKAVIFSIHSYVIPLAGLSDDDRAALDASGA